MKEAARPDLDAEKALLRAEMQLRRERAHAASGPKAALGLRDRFFEGPGAILRGLPGAVVSGFWPTGREIDVRPLLLALAGRGHKVVLPRTPARGLPLSFHRWRPGDALEPGRMGILQPPEAAERLDPDLLLVPLVAFDAGLEARLLGYRRVHARR